MTTNNHPAHGPVSLDRLHQICQYIERNNQYQNGGNLAYILADVLKVIDEVLERRNADSKPVAYADPQAFINLQAGEARREWMWRNPGEDLIPLYTAPPAPVSVPDAMEMDDDFDSAFEHGKAVGWNAFRAAILQGADGNSQINPDCWRRTCRPITLRDMRFVVCPDCGNKRCPRANNHRNACTGSNAPGQDGSAYPAVQQQEVK
ncbi:hypothetical protein OA819_04400 [Citrobacter freundii]|uniref:hypothetical protein n=1 Tax=Citrobacter freundii TaxID=546 RepID=UPI0025C8D327|nr:hypothetical protein [Citrobacter freundii]MDN4237944.1 hypothetical protein [Citrobacter freundii]MDN4316917.1 hypothetical protein [Citrobacter freundii]